MAQKLRFVVLDVFTSTRFLGNPLAIVHLPSGTSLSQTEKQLIAKEFNLVETVFLHETALDADPVTMNIFTINREIPFAGHPTIGTGWYLLSQNSAKDTVVLRPKAGDIPVVRSDAGVTLQIPNDFKIHAPSADKRIKSLQTLTSDADFVDGSDPPPVVSIVKGMTFAMIQVVSEESLRRLHPYREEFEGLKEDLGEWAGLMAVYAFYVEGEKDGVTTLRTRFFHGPLEDPATGSAGSALTGYLATKKGEGKWKFKIVQGIEMGRRSVISVEVDVGKDGGIKKILLAGDAVQVSEGWITV